MNYLNYWGKADIDNNYHLLVYHSMDVAAVGYSYLKKSKKLTSFISEQLDCSENAFLSLATFLLSLHDLGKFSEAFQVQRPDFIQLLQSREPNQNKIYNERHDSLGFWLWDDYLSETVLPVIGINDSSLNSWLQAVNGHHGMPPKSTGNIDNFFLKTDKKAAETFVLAMAELFLTEESKAIFSQKNSKQLSRTSEILSWWFAGVTVLSDWIGSNTQYFPYEKQTINLIDYWINAQIKAEIALIETGVLSVKTEKGQTINDFFPYIKQPSPLQQWAATVAIQKKPQIYLLEDVTGAGKTEAAILLAYRLMEAGVAEGFFIGLPTMATANAMYKRVAQVYQNLFTDNANLMLIHGFKKMVNDFAISIGNNQLEKTATAQCNSWLADYSKRALLASAGVGTIDQALLAVLHSKHQSLRLLGLFNKILIVDEVHACDTYMQKTLEKLLEFHARAGGSVILLSATLPNKMKQDLLNAYSKGRQQIAPLIKSDSYPLTTHWYDDQLILNELKLNSRANVSRTVNIHYESDLEKVFEHIQKSLKLGQCVGWIRNTVTDAMDAYTKLSQTIPPDKITLFHARFTLQDRLIKESQIIENFGEKSNKQNRQCRLMIATQVAEQSLDVDFDVLITDLAPIDRIMQRAGRLQRHVRTKEGNRQNNTELKDARDVPCLWVFAPKWTTKPKSDWYGGVFKKGQYVYNNHGQLWLTAKVLQSGSFTMPNDARQMIETVFSDTEEIPIELEKNSIESYGKKMSEASIAQQNTLKLDGGYKRGVIGDWWNDGKTPSRLGEEIVEVILVKWVDNGFIPWADGFELNSMVKISARLITKCEAVSDVQQLICNQLEQKYQRLVLPLTKQEDGYWYGKSWTSNKEPKLLTWLYDDNFGLRTL